MDTVSHWIKTAALPRFPTLDGPVTVDVAVVGAGIAGITAAYLARKAGLSVALIERGRCAHVDTGHTTAHLTAVTDLRLHEIQHVFGAAAARNVWDGGMAAIEQIETLAREEDIPCGFQRLDGYLHAANVAEDTPELRQEADAARGLGIEHEFQRAVPFFAVPGVRFPRQGLFHPLRYLEGLLRSIPGDGSHVFEQTAADEIAADHLTTAHGRVNFRAILIATHNPLAGDVGMIRATLFQSKLSLYTSYALGAKVPAGLLPEGLFWDTADPYNYLRVQRCQGYDYAIYGGEDHKTGQESDTVAAYGRVEAHLRKLAPMADIDARWSGQVIETNDGLPFIGEATDHQFIATGFAGNGMTFGTLSAMMFVDAITGRRNAWHELFDPHRKKCLGGTWSYLRENKDYPYFLIRDRLAPPEAESLRDLAPGEGKIVQLGKDKLAAYRDPAGRVTVCSAVCTHMQCIVGWNNAEKTWDCPCHGSRFQPDGQVISGPAEEPLKRMSPATGQPARPRRGVSTP